MSDFAVAYNRLNDAQKRAVDTIEGPVMVVAGPGTGKTQVLAMRVANILQKTQMRPSNILCLTFSVSGATAMRERLRQLIGADAYGVTVSTLHGFCQSIIDRHPMVFEEFAAREQLSDIEKYQRLNDIIDTVVQGSALIHQKDPHARDGDLLSRISQIKREGKTLDDLYAAAKTYRAAMEQKSKPGTKVHARNLLSAQKFEEFIEIYRLYQDMLTREGKYDYDDMILFALRALREEEWMLEGLQERYQYVLVDESQDTNGSQWDVIETLTTYAAVDHEPNLFVVGDDDQAIYRFQGANLQNMVRFHQRFPKAPIIVLTQNYRSTQVILDAAHSLIEHNDERLVKVIPGLDKKLTAMTKEKGESPMLLRAPSDIAEPWLIADLVEQRINDGVTAEEIAILTQTNSELFGLYDVLRSRNIPVVLHGKADLLAHPLVAEALSVLRELTDTRRDASIIGALSCGAFGCHPADLSRLSLLARERKTSVHQLLVDLASLDAPFLKREELVAARDAILDLKQKCDARTVLETVEAVLRMIIGGDSAKDPLDLAAVESFFQYVKAQCLEKPALRYEKFLKDIEFYADPLYGQTRLTYEIPHLVDEGVQLMTAHQSKGLEFHTVILANFRDGHWDNRRKPSSIAIPEDILFAWDDDQKKFEKHQDERRVAFVAMTRAKRELIFSCPRELSVGQKHKPVSPSAFFAEAGTLPEADGALQHPEQASLLLLQPQRDLDAEMQAYLRSRLEHFALSPTSLSRFLRDPQEFRRVDLLAQPEHFDERSMRSLGYGSAVHWALRQWGVARQKAEAFSFDQFFDAFAFYLNERTILTEQQRKDLLSLGEGALRPYFEQRLTGGDPILYSLEREYTAQLGDIPIKGKIDRIDQVSPNSGNVVVIDYKTGSAKSENDIRGGLEPGELSRTEEGDKFRQLAFYAVLLEKADPLITPVSFALEFVGERGEEAKRVELQVTDAEKDQLKKLIADVWKKIQSLDFSPLDQAATSAVLGSAIQKQVATVKKKAAKK